MVEDLQDRFYRQRRGKEAIIYLQNGVRLRGVLKAFDRFVLVLDIAGEEVLIYKGSISTVSSDGLDPLKRRYRLGQRKASGEREVEKETSLEKTASMSVAGEAEPKEDSRVENRQDPLEDFKDIIS